MSIVEDVIKHANGPTRDQRRAKTTSDLRNFAMSSLFAGYLLESFLHETSPTVGFGGLAFAAYLGASIFSAIEWNPTQKGDGYCSSVDSTEGKVQLWWPLMGPLTFPFKAIVLVENYFKARR